MAEQGYHFDNFVWGLKTVAPYYLEQFLHNRYRKKRIGQRELFKLEDVDIKWIKNIKTFRDKSVIHIPAPI
jgi:hypothetical protein